MSVSVRNYTSLPNLRFSSADAQGRSFGVLIVKMTFEIDKDGICVLSEDQEPLVLTDEYYGATHNSALRYPSDLTPFKPRADVIVNMIARAPGQKPRPSWICNVSVVDQKGLRIEKSLRVFGARVWRPQWRRRLSVREKRDWRKHGRLFSGWALGAPAPVPEIPIRYERAFGGLTEIKKDAGGRCIFQAYEKNPIGCGWLHPERSDLTVSHPAPQIEALDVPVTDPYCCYAPAGFGGIPPVWLPRRVLGGTYDQCWLDRVWPGWPADYNFEYHCAAAPDLRSPQFDYPDGSIICTIENRTEDGAGTQEKLVLSNPTLLISMSEDHAAARIVRLNLDTLVFDLVDTDRANWRIYVSGRVVFPLHKNMQINIQHKPDWMNLKKNALMDAFPNASPPEAIIYRMDENSRLAINR